MKLDGRYWKAVQDNYWLWIIGLVFIFVLLLIKLTYNIDINSVQQYYKEEMDKCICPQYDNMNYGVLNYETKNISKYSEEPSGEIR